MSALVPFQGRIAELIGVDIHEPEPPLPWLNRFVRADLCRDADAFSPATFDAALSSFTVEHLEDPSAAFRLLFGWLRPRGAIVVATVNRGHPFVNAYLSIPRAVRRPLQRLGRGSAANAHELVGRCNTPAALRDALGSAGFVEVELVTTDDLARTLARRLPAFGAGLIGDLAAHGYPARRSAIVARALRPG